MRTEAWVLVISAYVLTVFAYVWPPDFRNASTTYVLLAWAAFMVRTLLYHGSLVLIVVAAIAAWKRQKRLLCAALPILVVTAGPTWWQYRPRTPPPAQGETITVMSVNLLMANDRTEAILAEIRSANPDVLLLQEYSEPWDRAIRPALGAEYPHARRVVRDDSFGIAAYSRPPFVGEVNVELPLGSDEVPQIRAVIRVHDRDVAIYNVHLLPPRKLDYAIEMRLQFADLLDRLAGEPLPVILGGDFNFTENSPNADALARLGFAEAHELAGRGRGATWPVNAFFRFLPGLRLDHLYLGKALTCTEMRTGIGEGSDHRPVIAKVGFRQ